MKESTKQAILALKRKLQGQRSICKYYSVTVSYRAARKGVK